MVEPSFINLWWAVLLRLRCDAQVLDAEFCSFRNKRCSASTLGGCATVLESISWTKNDRRQHIIVAGGSATTLAQRIGAVEDNTTLLEWGARQRDQCLGTVGAAPRHTNPCKRTWRTTRSALGRQVAAPQWYETKMFIFMQFFLQSESLLAFFLVFSSE